VIADAPHRAEDRIRFAEGQRHISRLDYAPTLKEVDGHNLRIPPMREFEIYLPMKMNDGTPVDPREIQRVKDELFKTFGGYTHLNQQSEGAWRMGGVTFRDDVTIVRVIDDASTNFDMPAFRKSIEAALKQEQVLIISREVAIV
jgi:hypothetical protein